MHAMQWDAVHHCCLVSCIGMGNEQAKERGRDEGASGVSDNIPFIVFGMSYSTELASLFYKMGTFKH